MRDKITLLVAGYCLGVMTLVGCASSFPWLYYGTQMQPECYDKGTLLGAGIPGWKDQPLTECKPDDAKKLKCITLFVDDFYSLKADDQKCHSDLEACQKGPKP